MADTSHMLHSYCSPTADKNVLDSRVIKLEVNSPLYLTFKSKHKYMVNLVNVITAPGFIDCSSREGDSAQNADYQG